MADWEIEAEEPATAGDWEIEAEAPSRQRSRLYEQHQAALDAPHHRGGHGFSATDPRRLDVDDAERARQERMRPMTMEQLGRDLSSTVQATEALGRGAKLFADASSFRHARSVLEQFDLIDAGRMPTTADGSGKLQASEPWVRSYDAAPADGRADLRRRLIERMANDREVINAGAQAITDLREQAAKKTGTMPEGTDITSPTELARWFVRNGLANSGPMAISMASAVLGVPGFAAASGTMALGDLMGDAVEHTQNLAPERFTNPDRRDAAAQALPGLRAERLADATPSVGAAAVPYMLADKLGYEGRLMKSMIGPAATSAGQAIKRTVKETALGTPNEMIGEGAQKAVSVATQKERGESPSDWTPEDVHAIVNEALAGATGGPVAVAARAPVEAARVAMENSRLRQRAEQGDVAAAVELALRDRAQRQRTEQNTSTGVPVTSTGVPVDNPVDSPGAAQDQGGGTPSVGAGGTQPTPAAAPTALAAPSILDRMGVTRVDGSQEDFGALADEIAGLEAARRRIEAAPAETPPEASIIPQPQAPSDASPTNPDASATGVRAGTVGGEPGASAGDARSPGASPGPVGLRQPAAPAQSGGDDSGTQRLAGEGVQTDAVVDTWTGRKGRGFATEAEATLALPRRQKESPDLDWSPEPLADTGRWQLVGRARPAPQAQAIDTAAPRTPAPNTRSEQTSSPAQTVAVQSDAEPLVTRVTSGSPNEVAPPQATGGEATVVPGAAPPAQPAPVSQPSAPLSSVQAPQWGQRTEARGMARHPTTVMGSAMLADVSRAVGGLDPAWLSEISTRVETQRVGRDGRPVIQWRNPMIPGVGKLFRPGGTQDLQLLAETLEERGYLPPGSVARDAKEAGEQAKEMIRAALNREEVKTREQVEREEVAAADAEREAYYAELDAEDAREAEAERQAIIASNAIDAQRLDATPDEDVPWGMGANILTGAAAMRAMGFTEQEIADAQRTEALHEGRTGGQARQDGPEGPRPPPGVGSTTAQPDGATTQEGLTLEAQTPEDLRAKAAREQSAEQAERARKVAVEARLRKDAADRDNRARADATLDHFELGQSAEQQMSGMGDLFAQESRPSHSEFDGTQVEQQVRMADTGEVATLRMDAGPALRDADSRVDTLRKLVECLAR